MVVRDPLKLTEIDVVLLLDCVVAPDCDVSVRVLENARSLDFSSSFPHTFILATIRMG